MNILITFPGQGSQSPKILEDAQHLPESLIKTYLEALNNIGIDLKKIITQTPELLNQTTITQPVLLGLSYITYEHYKKFLDNYQVTLSGHSLGELTAACVAFDLSLEKSIQLAQRRAELMELSMKQNNIKTSTIALLGAYTQEVENIISLQDQVWAINFNSTAQTVLTGASDSIEHISKLLQQLPTTKRIIPIPMSVSSHCPLLEGVASAWGSVLSETFKGKKLKFSVASNVTADIHHQEEPVINNLQQTLTQPVLYHQMITNLLPQDIVLELGSGKILTNLNKRISKDFQALSSSELQTFIQDQNISRENITS